MPKSKLQLERVNALWFICFGVTSIVASILIYILLLESALGAFSIREVYPSSIGAREGPAVAVLNSDHTRRAHEITNPQNPSTGWVDATLASWRQTLLDRKVAFTQITDGQLEFNDITNFDLLILPSITALSDQQVAKIKDFMNQGGNVLATGTPGLYLPDGRWRGWTFVEEVFGVQFNNYIQSTGGNYRTYADTLGVCNDTAPPPGIYRQVLLDDPNNPDSLNTSQTPTDSLQLRDPGYLFRQRMRLFASSANFPALRGFEWSDTLRTRPPRANYARVDTVMAVVPCLGDSLIQRRPALAITYYTWLGGAASDFRKPFPSTGPGIKRFTLVSQNPLTAHIRPGFRVKIQVYNPGVMMSVREERTKVAGFWYDFATESRAMPEAINMTAGLVYGTYGNGRFVYMGVQKDALGLGPDDLEDQEVIGHLFTNMMTYLQRDAVAWIHEWPFSFDDPYRSAALLVGIGESEIQNFAGVADLFEREEIPVPGTFMVRPERVQNYKALMQRLYQLGDVGVYDTLRLERDGSEEFQLDRISGLKSLLEDVVEGPVTGYRSTQTGIFSNRTMGALTDAAFDYFLPDSIGRIMMPKIMGFPYQDLTRFGLTVRSDEELLDPNGPVDPAATQFLGDILRVGFEGSMYNLIYSSDLLARPKYRNTMATIVQELRDRNFWIASGDDLHQWWRARHAVQAEVEQRGPSRIVVRMSSGHSRPVHDVGLSIGLGNPAARIEIRSELISDDPPAYELLENGTVLTLALDEMKPQQSMVYHIDLLNEDGNALIASN